MARTLSVRIGRIGGLTHTRQVDDAFGLTDSQVYDRALVLSETTGLTDVSSPVVTASDSSTYSDTYSNTY